MTLHMQHDTSSHQLNKHVGKLGTFFAAREEVQDIARVAAGSVAPLQLGAGQGNCVKDRGKCVQHWYLRTQNISILDFAIWDDVEFILNV